MGILGARPGDLWACIYARDHEACERVYWGYFLWPRLQHLLEQLELLEAPIPPLPGPGPDPAPTVVQEMVPILLASLMGDPTPEPGLPVACRIKTLVRLRDGLQQFTKELDADIVQLEQQIKAGD